MLPQSLYLALQSTETKFYNIYFVFWAYHFGHREKERLMPFVTIQHYRTPQRVGRRYIYIYGLEQHRLIYVCYC